MTSVTLARPRAQRQTRQQTAKAVREPAKAQSSLLRGDGGKLLTVLLILISGPFLIQLLVIMGPLALRFLLVLIGGGI